MRLIEVTISGGRITESDVARFSVDKSGKMKVDYIDAHQALRQHVERALSEADQKDALIRAFGNSMFIQLRED